MPDYKYIAVDGSTGKKISGMITALNTEILKNTLKTENKVYISHKEASNNSIKSTKKDGNNLRKISFKKTIKSNDLSNLCRQLSIIVSSGVNLMTSIASLTEQTKDKTLKAELKRIYNGLQMGKTMSDVMSEPNSKFPPILAGMVKTGEASGTLDTILHSMSGYFARDSVLKNKIKSASMYPTFLAIMPTVMVIGFLRFILPSMLEIITSNGGTLPAITQFVVGLADMLKDNFIPVIVGLAAIVAGIKLFLKTERGRIIKDNILMRTPVLNSAIRNVITARFSQGISLFISSGYPLLDGMGLLLNTANNTMAEQSIKAAMQGVSRGETLAFNLAKNKFFDSLFIQMLSVGEQTGALDTITKEMSDYYTQESELGISRAVALIEPVMMLVIGGLVGFLVIAIALPMFSMYKDIG